MIIGIDMDGTCVTHEYPAIGKDIGAAPVLKALVANGHKLMLWTMRDHQIHRDVKQYVDVYKLKPTDHDCLQEAIDWFRDRDIPLWGINDNPDQTWTESKKQYANLYIDDTALGTPLVGGHVDWREVLVILHNKGLITREQVQNILMDKDWIEQVTANYY